MPAATFADLLAVAAEEVQAATGYVHVWFGVAEDEEARVLRLLQYSGDKHASVWDVAPILKVDGDLFLEAVVRSDVPIVIEDARTDPRTNKQIVERLQNRTLINIPLRLLDKPLGIFGIGTFGEEGCRAPTSAQLDYLAGMGSQIAVAAGRIRFIEARLLAEKDRQVMERRLAQVQKLESLGLLAGGIAHDFNNLLTVILSGTSLLLDRLTDNTMREDAAAVIGAAQRAQQLTRQLLAMSRDQDLRLEPTDMNGRLTVLLELVRRVLPETIRIDFIEGANLPLVEADQFQLDQVFMNICINARDAMPGGGRLTMTTEQTVINGAFVQSHPWAKPGTYVVATLTDTGAGMTREVLGQGVRTLLHHEGAQRRHRARPGGFLRDRSKTRRRHPVFEHARRGQHLQGLLACNTSGACGHTKNVTARSDRARARAHPGGGGRRSRARDRGAHSSRGRIRSHIRGQWGRSLRSGAHSGLRSGAARRGDARIVLSPSARSLARAEAGPAHHLGQWVRGRREPQRPQPRRRG